MKKIAIIILFVLGYSHASAQKISIDVDGTMVEIQSQQTQTEIKPGWKIVDIQLKSKLVRYLWGKQARVFSDEKRPAFLVTPAEEGVLSDLVFIKLKQKNEYRRIPKSIILENNVVPVDLSNFDIKVQGDSTFMIRPRQDMEPGEYVMTWLNAPLIGEYEDWTVWAFCIKK